MAAYKLQGRLKFQGLDISIENRKGSIRRWYDPHGKETGHTTMHFDYGYIRKTEGTDGDHVDVYVGPNAESTKVFVVDQMKKPPNDDGKMAWTKFDEQKCMLGFDSAKDAKAAYLKQYDDPRFFGSMKEMSMEDFTTKVLDRDNHGKKVAAVSGFLKLALGDLSVDGSPGVGSLPAVTSYSAAEPARVAPRNTERRPSKRAMAEFNLAKLASGEDFAIASDVMLHDFPITATRRTAPAGATKKAEDSTSSDDTSRNKRVERAAERIDDAGIAMLAAPTAGKLIGAGLSRTKSPMLQGAGKAISTFSSHPAVHTTSELGGLALVAPGISKTIAKRVVGRPEKRAALEKLAERFYTDFEYLPEPEKLAILERLVAPATRRLIVASEGAAARVARKAGEGLKAEAPGVGGKLVEAVKQKIAPVPRTYAVPGHAAVGTPRPSPGATAALPASTTRTKSWSPLTGKNLALAGGAAALGLGTYAGYKGIETTGNLLQRSREPVAPSSFAGPGRLF